MALDENTLELLQSEKETANNRNESDIPNKTIRPIRRLAPQVNVKWELGIGNQGKKISKTKPNISKTFSDFSCCYKKFNYCQQEFI